MPKDDLELGISTYIDEDGYRNADSYAEYLQSRLGKSISDGITKPLEDGKKRVLEIAKIGEKFSATIFTQTQKTNKISKAKGSTFSLGSFFTKEQSDYLMGLGGGLSARDYESVANRMLKQTRGRQFADIITNRLSGAEKTRFELSMLNDELDVLRSNLNNIRDDSAPAFQETTKQIDETIVKIQELKKVLEKQTRKNFVERLVDTFKRISITRVLRNILRFIEQGFKQGIQNLAQFDSSVNETMSKLTSSFTTIFNSLTVAVYPIIEAITPLMQQIAGVVAEIANGISRATASAKGLSTYTKINANYMKEFADSSKSALLSFDKFESLNIEDNDMFSEQSIDGETSQLEGVGNTIFRIFNSVIEIVKELFSIINDWIKMFGPLIKPVLDIIDGIVQQIEGAVKIIGGLIKILYGDFEGAWQDIGNGFKDMCNGIINMFIALGGFIMKILNTIFIKTNPIFWLIKAFGGPDVGQIADNWINQWSGYKVDWKEDGGKVSGASLFWAGDNHKTELVTTASNGGTYVSNMEQLENAVYSAGVRLALDGYFDNNVTVNNNIDPAYIASSPRFTNEMNRRNAGLNLR